MWGWQPLWLVPEQVREAANTLYGHRAHSIEFLAAGLLNQSWRVATRDETFVLRASRAERARLQIEYEHAVTIELHRHAPGVVPPLAGQDSHTVQRWHDHIVSLFPFISGALASTIPPRTYVPMAAQTLAQLHVASQRYVRLDQRPGFQSIDVQPWQIWQAVRPVLLDHFGDCPSELGLLSLIQREVEELDVWLSRLRKNRRLQARGVVHGDFNPRNLICRNDSLTAVIDWDDCRIEPFVWEVAHVAFASPGASPDRFWTTYVDAGGPLERWDRDLLGGFARLGSLAELQWTIKAGRATPHAAGQIRHVLDDLERIKALERPS